MSILSSPHLFHQGFSSGPELDIMDLFGGDSHSDPGFSTGAKQHDDGVQQPGSTVAAGHVSVIFLDKVLLPCRACTRSSSA